MSVLSATDLHIYCAPLLLPNAHTEFATHAGLSNETARLYLQAVCNEAQTGLRLLEWAGLQQNQRVLEVGAGGGLLCGFLQSRGVDIVGIEPTGWGYDTTPKLASFIAGATRVTARILPLAARDLDPRKIGLYDMIFSVNVIEHFQPLSDNLDGLARVMDRGSVQVHTCANYRVPYEPHYGIALLPFAPQLTPFLGRRRSESLWHSLNFITAADLRNHAKRFGLALSFRQGMLGEAIERLIDEPAFAARHPPILRSAAAALKATGLTGILKNLPPQWVTPMTASLRRLPP